MKYLTFAALVAPAFSIKISAAPDVYGPNGNGYTNVDASIAGGDIGINFHEQGTGDQCAEGDWASVHWVGTLPDGRVVTDSRAEAGGLPKTFAVGAHQVYPCWDFAVKYMKKGSKASVSCPSYYAWGGAYTQSPLGGEPIPLNSDVIFDLEVLDCNRTPTFTEQTFQPMTTTMQPDRCMYLHLEESEHTGTQDLVLTKQGKDVFVTHKQIHDPTQEWWYDDDTAHI